jgi:hypothetical protein
MCYLKHFYVLTSIGVLYDNNQSVPFLGEECGLRGVRSKQDIRGINKKIRICTSGEESQVGEDFCKFPHILRCWRLVWNNL